MADTHEPEDQERPKRDRSVITNPPLRWAVLVVFILAGALILSKGFNGSGLASGSTGGSGNSGGSGPQTTPPTTSHPSSTRPSTATTPPLTGITVAIYNSTNTSGLAGNERQKLETDGWDVVSIGDTRLHFTTTTIYYLPGAKTQADFMKATYYPTAVVLPAVQGFNSAKITLVLGTEFAATP